MSEDNAQKNKVRLREIASAAGVSISTASRVLNGSTRVRPSLKKTVLDVVSQMDIDLYQRDKVKSLAFLVGNRGVNDPFHSRILLGAEDACVAHGWNILFLCFNYSPNTPWKELPLPQVVQRHDMVRGVLLTGTNFGNLIELLYNKGITSVALANNLVGDPELLNTDAVFSDDIQGSTDATSYLIGLGHRDIWFLGNNRLPWFARCYRGYCRAMEEAGLTPRQISIDSENNDEIGYLGVKSVLARGERITAVFAGNDPIANGVYKGLRDSGLSIPDDVSVVGCNDTLGGILYPALTTVREFPEQLGKRMVELLLNRIARPSMDPQSTTVPTQFIKRDSCRPILLPKASEYATDIAV